MQLKIKWKMSPEKIKFMHWCSTSSSQYCIYIFILKTVFSFPFSLSLSLWIRNLTEFKPILTRENDIYIYIETKKERIEMKWNFEMRVMHIKFRSIKMCWTLTNCIILYFFWIFTCMFLKRIKHENENINKRIRICLVYCLHCVCFIFALSSCIFCCFWGMYYAKLKCTEIYLHLFTLGCPFLLIYLFLDYMCLIFGWIPNIL